MCFTSFRCLVAVSLLALSSCALAQDDYLNHLIFTNSPTPDNDFYTGARAVEPSTLEASDGRLLVDTHTFFTPPNALRVQWRSVEGGSWDAEIRVVSYDNRPTDLRGDTLSFWCYSAERVAQDDLPQIQLTDDNHNFTARMDLGEFAGSMPAQKWVRVRIPLSRFATESIHPFDPQVLHSIFFEQGKADDVPHSLLVDEIRIDDEPAPSAAVPAALPVPSNLRAEAFERHVDLKWESKDSDQLAYTLIYRSIDGGPFEAVGIQQPGLHRYADFLGKLNVHVTYKVAVLDKQYRASAFSRPVSAETYPMSDDELLSMLQEECFRYYWERGSHPVSGMALESVPGDPRIVATGASGFGIMAIVVGMERDFITQPQGMERLTRIVSFLEKAQRYHGAWPHFMDGTTGHTMPVFGMFDDGGDLVETSFLMEGLTGRAAVCSVVVAPPACAGCAHQSLVGHGRVGLVSEPARLKGSDLALVARVVVAHRSQAHRVQRDDGDLSARHGFAHARNFGGHLLRRMGQPVRQRRSSIAWRGRAQPTARSTKTVTPTMASSSTSV